MTNAKTLTGIVLDIQKAEYNDKITLISVNPRPYESTNIFTSFFPQDCATIALHFLVKFRGEYPGIYDKNTVIQRYGTHIYDVANVLSKDGQLLRLFGQKIGEITYNIDQSEYELRNFIQTSDNLLIKFPPKIGQYIQIIDNITYQQRKQKFIEQCRTPGWARDPIPKYEFNSYGLMLRNKRTKIN